MYPDLGEESFATSQTMILGIAPHKGSVCSILLSKLPFPSNFHPLPKKTKKKSLINISVAALRRRNSKQLEQRTAGATASVATTAPATPATASEIQTSLGEGGAKQVDVRVNQMLLVFSSCENNNNNNKSWFYGLECVRLFPYHHG